MVADVLDYLSSWAAFPSSVCYVYPLDCVKLRLLILGMLEVVNLYSFQGIGALFRSAAPILMIRI